MGRKQKGQLAVSKEWAKHLRKFWRRQYWKMERFAGHPSRYQQLIIGDPTIGGCLFGIHGNGAWNQDWKNAQSESKVMS